MTAQPETVEQIIKEMGVAGNHLDQLHDEMANALIRIVQCIMGIKNSGAKYNEGVDSVDELKDWADSLGTSLALADIPLKQYAAVAEGKLIPPPGNYAASLEAKVRELESRALLPVEQGVPEIVKREAVLDAIELKTASHFWGGTDAEFREWVYNRAHSAIVGDALEPIPVHPAPSDSALK